MGIIDPTKCGGLNQSPQSNIGFLKLAPACAALTGAIYVLALRALHTQGIGEKNVAAPDMTSFVYVILLACTLIYFRTSYKISEFTRELYSAQKNLGKVD